MHYAIDRFEDNGWAVLEREDGETFNVLRRNNAIAEERRAIEATVRILNKPGDIALLPYI